MDITQILDVSKGFSGVWTIIFGAIGTFLASCFIIQISPLKFDPLKWLTRAISRSVKDWFKDVIDNSLEEIKEEDKKRDEAITKMDGAIEGLNQKIDKISDRIDANENRAQANHIAAIRRSILTFGNQIRSGLDASKESFDDIIEQYDEYSEYVRTNEISNGKMDLTIKLIRDRYDDLFNHVPDDHHSSHETHTHDES